MSTEFPERDRLAHSGLAAPDLRYLTVSNALMQEQRAALDAAGSAPAGTQGVPARLRFESAFPAQ
jgi:hypothetical protein